MIPTHEARMFAEAIGKAVAFGASITCCDIFNSPTIKGFIHYVPKPQSSNYTLRKSFTDEAFRKWKAMMEVAEVMAHNNGHDPCQYGVVITRYQDTVSMGIGRHYYSLSSAIDSANDDAVNTVWDLSSIMVPINLECQPTS